MEAEKEREEAREKAYAISQQAAQAKVNHNDYSYTGNAVHYTETETREYYLNGQRASGPIEHAYINRDGSVGLYPSSTDVAEWSKYPTSSSDNNGMTYYSGGLSSSGGGTSYVNNHSCGGMMGQ